MKCNLHDAAFKGLNFSWKQKLIIASDIIQGVLYLHSYKPAIIHGDLKVNILRGNISEVIIKLMMLFVMSPILLFVKSFVLSYSQQMC